MHTSATTRRSARGNDFYATPSWATEKLLSRVPMQGSVLEPCSGEKDIANVLMKSGLSVTTNDIAGVNPDFNFDMTRERSWSELPDFDYVVTNPPFNKSAEIVPLAYKKARVGVAMLLRITWLEPCKDRVKFLEENPPSTIIVLPRISFTRNGKTDSVTCAWIVWNKLHREHDGIFICGKGDQT